MKNTASMRMALHSRLPIVLALLLTFAFLSNVYAKDTSASASAINNAKIQSVLMEAYEKYKNDDGGKNADYIKELAIVNPKIFGISIVTADGKVYEAGDTEAAVSIQSISKVLRQHS